MVIGEVGIEVGSVGGALLSGVAHEAVDGRAASAELSLLRSFLTSEYAPEQVIGIQAALASFQARGEPIDPAVDAGVLVEVAVAAQRLASWAMSAQVTVATEVYRRRAVAANSAVLAGDWSEVEGADLARRSTAAEIGLACGVTEFQARRRLQVGWALAVRPAAFARLGDAFARGRVELAKVQAVSESLGRIEDDATVGAVVEALLPGLPTVTMPRLRSALDAAVSQAMPAGAEAAAERARSDRGIDYRALPDAMGQVTAALPIEAMLAVRAALANLSDFAATPDDLRTVTQREADTLVEVLACAAAGEPLVRGWVESAESAQSVESAQLTGDARRRGGRGRRGRRARTEVVVTVPLSVLFPVPQGPVDGSGDGSADGSGGALLHGYGPIPANVVRELAADAVWRCAVVDDEHGTLLAMGRSGFTPSYAPGAALVEHVVTRDVACRFPGCARRAATCEIDHLVPFPTGATCSCNTHALCSHHHRLKHETPWRVTVDDDVDAPPGTVAWTSPTGRRFVVPGTRLTVPPLPRPRSDRAGSPGGAGVGGAGVGGAGVGGAGAGGLRPGNRYDAPPPECDELLPSAIVPVRRSDGRIDYLDTREKGPWDVARRATPSEDGDGADDGATPPPF